MSYQWYRFDPWPRNFICCRCSQKKPPKTINPTFLYSQARYESQRIQMESELAVQLEQRVTERLAQAQESSLRQAASLREHHRYRGLPAAASPQPRQVVFVPCPHPCGPFCHSPVPWLPSVSQALSLLVGELPSGSQGEAGVLGSFQFSSHREEHLTTD